MVLQTWITKCVQEGGLVQIPNGIMQELQINIGDELTVAVLEHGVAFIKKS